MATVIKKTVQKEKISITDGKKLYFIDNESAYKQLSPIWGLTQTANFTLVLQYIKCLIFKFKGQGQTCTCISGQGHISYSQ